MGTVRDLRRALAAAALVGLAAVAPLQLATGGGSPAGAEVTYDACGVVTTKADGSSWSCSYVDNFDGRSLDPAKWITQSTAVTGFRSGQTCFTTSDKNIKVRKGALELIALALPGKFTCKSPTGDFTTKYTGGMVGTRGKFSQTYGKFEVRAKFPTARTSGVHGGFWMFPLNLKYGPWPASGEIDVAEWWSHEPTLVLPSLHYKGRDYLVDSGWNCRVADVSQFHTYTVDWQPSAISFFIDGTLCFTRTPDPDAPLVAPQPFDHPFSMILNMGVGTEGGQNAITASTPLPATFFVDYAKAWK
ncbi:glycoside hydrolase family 16 protein [Nocardioides stalactiti]|uniref:glycoside hydrolase family 16 protein n=1 Tax=Nocardioides stalactiti TaxID=2755356 RepID=UPI0016018B40|nr:glycoside hydrolase family 16 protein [Nocardioides stalactiti]